MIKHMRIDNRLIHGQVAVTWRSFIQADAITVVNDQVANDPIQKMALPLAARGSKVLVLTHDELTKQETENPDEVLFVIAKFPSDALEILQSGLKVEEVNVGNAAPITGTDYVMVTKSIAVTKDDAKIYHEIADLLGGKLTTQMLPTESKEDFIALMAKKGL